MNQNLNKNSKSVKEYSTDGKVRHFSTEEDINEKLGKKQLRLLI